LIPTAPAKTRIPEKTSPDATTSPVFGRSDLRPPPLFPPFEPGALGVVVVPEWSGLFGFSVVDEEVLGSTVVVVVVVVSSSLPLWFSGSSGVVVGVFLGSSVVVTVVVVVVGS
jgi:hypothetical protein